MKQMKKVCDLVGGSTPDTPNVQIGSWGERSDSRTLPYQMLETDTISRLDKLESSTPADQLD